MNLVFQHSTFITGEDSDYYNGSAEISEIDERLSKLQALMKNSLD